MNEAQIHNTDGDPAVVLLDLGGDLGITPHVFGFIRLIEADFADITEVLAHTEGTHKKPSEKCPACYGDRDVTEAIVEHYELDPAAAGLEDEEV